MKVKNVFITAAAALGALCLVVNNSLSFLIDSVLPSDLMEGFKKAKEQWVTEEQENKRLIKDHKLIIETREESERQLGEDN
jgi:hypothetical protein